MPTEIERLYREQRAGLVRLVERELHNHHDAEDVVQTAFLDAQRALKRGTIPRNPRAWLAAIALNAARRLRRRRVNAEPLEEHAVHEAMRMPEIRAALANLPKEQRTAVLYRDVLGLSYGETADQMGTSVNAVTMLLHRGRQRLRQALGITVGGFGVWRWLKRAGMPQQIAAAKGAAAVVVATGLATTGIVAARVVAPIGSDAAATVPTQAVGPTAGAQPKSGGALPSQATHRRFATAYSSKARAAGPSTRESSTAATPAAVVASTAPTTTSSLLHSVLPAPTVSLPVTLTSPVSATVAVSTPITTVTVSTPTGTTLTVTTPITTVTVPIP